MCFIVLKNHTDKSENNIFEERGERTEAERFVKSPI